MPMSLDGVEYLSNNEAMQELSALGVNSSSTLRSAAKRRGIQSYYFDISPNRVWWKKSDIELLKMPRPSEEREK
jgi:hypothetical protein